MSVLAYHHKELVTFLKEVRETTPELSFITPKTEECKLFNLVINSGDTLIKQASAAAVIDVKSPHLRKKIQLNLNELLKTFSEKYGIQPPIKLFFSTRGRYAGGHFACCDLLEDNASSSEHFMRLEDLQKQLENARQRLGLVFSASSQPVKLKYLHNMKEVLKWDNDGVDAKWFRKTGPIAADFRAGHVYERKELLHELNELVSKNKISVLEGDGGTGKSVLIRNYAYNLINNEPKTQIFHFSFKLDLSIDSYREFIDELNSINGIAIIEDVHLAISEMQCVLDEFNKDGNCTILLTARSMFKFNMLKSRPNVIEKLEILSIDTKSKSNYFLGYDDTDNIIEHYILKRFGKNYSWTSLLKTSIKTKCTNNLWLLTYALNSCTEEGCSESCIEKGVMDDLEEIEKMGYNPEILLALSPLYMYERPTSQLFLLKKLGFGRGEINELLKTGEIIKQNINGKTYYGLPHSSLASAYWEYGNSYRECLLFPEYKDFIYNYVISDVPNGLEAITKNSYEIITYLLNRLACENNLLKVLERPENEEAYRPLSDIFANSLSPDFEWPYALDKFYYSEGFLKYLSELLLKNHFFSELSFLTYRYHLILKKHISSINIKYLLNEIYASEHYADGCEYLYQISRIDKGLMSEICKALDPSKFANMANRDNYLENIWITLKYLFFVDENIGIRFWKDLDKNLLLNTFDENDFSVRSHALWRICAWGQEIKSDVCEALDFEKLAQTANICKNPFSTLIMLKNLSKIDIKVQIIFWEKLDKKLLAQKILTQKEPWKVASAFSDVYEMSQQIQKEFLENYFDIKKLEEIIYEPNNFSSIVKKSTVISDKGYCELFDRLDSSKIEKLYKQHTDILERMHFLAALCEIKSTTGTKLIYLLREDAEEFARISIQMGRMREIVNYNFIANADIEAAQIVYKYIREYIGIENYIKKVLDTNSLGDKDDCFDFLLKVDPKNEHGWGKYFNWKPSELCVENYRRVRRTRKKPNV